MQQSIDPVSEIVAQSKYNFEQSSKRLIHLLSYVPDDKLTWTPSLSARSSLRIAGHCALTNKFFADIITGNTHGSMPSPEEFSKNLHEAEAKITTRESALALLQETTRELCNAIDTVNAHNIEAAQNSPFGPMPMRFWLDQGREHMAGHARQLEYLQTIWGDLDNHMN